MVKTTNRELINGLTQVLAWANVRELPPKEKGNDIWIYAIAVGKKRDGSKSYISLERTDDGSYKIIRDFGSSSGIVEVVDIRPVLYLDESYLPVFKKKDGDKEKIGWLKAQGVKKDLSSMDAKEIGLEVIAVAVRNKKRAVAKYF